MSNPVAIVEQETHHHDEPTPPARPDRETPASARFAYPSGSQPLSGFTIKRGLGHGGFGEVYYATSDAGKEVALKLIRRNLEVELRGIRHCLNLKHPNLLSIYDLREDEQGDKWVVMEYLAGQTLEDAIVAHPLGMAEEEAMAWLHGIGAGLACLHDHGIVHRDLKPGNIFCDQGYVKIGDYGLSKFISCSRRSGQTESVGTVHYMAPEVANGRYGKEIDIYALGVILFEMLTGRVPFEGESVGEVLMKHLTARPDVSVLDEPYRSVVARALEKDPAQRFASITEFLVGLPRPLQALVTPSPACEPRSDVPPTHPGEARRPEPPGPPPVPPLKRPAEEPAEAIVLTPLNTDNFVDEEPILRALQEGGRELRAGWNSLNLNGAMKILVLIGLALVALVTTGIWMPPLFLLLILYGCYRVVRWFVLPMAESQPRPPVARRSPPPPPPPASPPPVRTEAYTPPAARHVPRWERRRFEAAELVRKPSRERAAELFGSMVVGSLVAATMCVVAVILNTFRSAAPLPQQVAWLVAMSVLGTWAVLVPAKSWEGREGDPLVRRFVLMVVGLGLGLVAFAVASYLSPVAGQPIALPVDAVSNPQNFSPPRNFYIEDRPMALAYMACFGSLFALVRWWRQTDPLRPARLSLWSMLLTLLTAWLVTVVWRFPSQAWLLMTACSISVAVQLASPWLTSHQRRVPGGSGE